MFLLCDAPLKELHACLTRDGANATFDGTNLIFAGKGIQLWYSTPFMAPGIVK